MILDKKKTHMFQPEIDGQSYESLRNFVKKNPFQKDAVLLYLEKYQNLHKNDEEGNIVYCQLLAYRYALRPWKSLNDLAEIYMKRNNITQAYMCLVESLRINPEQTEIYKKACEIKELAQPVFPKELKADKYAVSVIMKTYNRLNEIKTSIKSLLRQSFQDFELVIINDGGSDKLKDIVDSFHSAKIKYYKLDKNMGFSRATNEGLLRAEGKYITFLDDDDIYYPDHLESLVKEMEPGRPIVYSNTQCVIGKFENGTFEKLYVDFIWNEKFDRNKMVQKVFLSNTVLMYRKEILKSVGLLNEKMDMTEDQDFWLRCALKYDFYHVNKTSSEYRRADQNTVIKNMLSACFFGNLVQKYYRFHNGKIAFAKHFLKRGDLYKSYGLYEEMRQKYDSYFKSSMLIGELIELAVIFDDRKFLTQLASDYFRFDAKECVKTIQKYHSVEMFLGIAPQLPMRIMKGAVGRANNLFELRLRRSQNNMDKSVPTDGLS